ncbi:MAG: Ig-like domain-containing protein, partial [Bifidobacteriaceae bacterium]|nr:Ig-like domain-containing protein [Bifidobacteriaceae bacterium]
MSATIPADRRADRSADRARASARVAALVTVVGVLAALGVVGLPLRAAATEYLNGWNGAFTRDQLYALGGGQLNSAYAWNRPWAVTTLPTADRIFDKSKGANGTSTSNQWETFAVGPVYAANGDYTLHGLGWYSTTGSPVTLMERDNSKRQLNAIALGPFLGSAAGRSCVGGSALGGEINQKDGYVYALMAGANQSFASNAAPATGVRLSIYQIVKTSSSRSVVCVATNGGSLTPRTRTIYESWSAQFSGTPPFSAGATWGLASDVAIDANGDAYLFGHNAANRHVLLRINVPRDASGQINPSGEFTYDVVKFFTETSNNSAVYGLTFMNGKLYVQDAGGGLMWRYDPLVGTVEALGSGGPNPARDLASAHMAPVVEGAVFNDANGNSVRDTGEGGAAGVVIEVWQRAAGQAGWTAVGEVETDYWGAYSVLLPLAPAEFLLRLRQPRLAGANAVQTYASAGQFGFRGGAPNIVLAYCFNQTGNYRPKDSSGACHGARADGIDPPTTTDPVGATGGAAIVSHIVVTNDLAAVTADFGITTAGSWGDAPSVYKTSNAQYGPYANPGIGSDNYLYLGARAGVYSDGRPSTAADAHPTDDSLELAPKIPGTADADLPWQPAQDQIMVAGQTYRVRAKASGLAAAVAASHVKAWITGLTAAGATSATMDQALLGGAGCADSPDANGHVYCDHTPATTLPSGGIAPVFARVRVDASSRFTATSRGPTPAVSEAWMPKGEIEDYRMGVAGGVLRLEARNLGGVAANVELALTNVAAAAPSSDTDSILTAKSGAFTTSGRGHAIISRTAATTITARGVGQAGASQLNGWSLGDATRAGKPVDTWCRNTADGADLGATVDTAAGRLTIPAPASGQLPPDITCQLTFTPTADPAASTVTADPSDNSAPGDRLVVPDATSEVKVDVNGQIQDAAGASQSRPAAGGTVRLELSGAAATLQYLEDDGVTWKDAGPALTCVTGEDGHCLRRVRVKARARGVYNLAASIGGVYLKGAASGQPTNTAPVQIWFKEGTAAQGLIELTDTADKLADFGQAGSGQGDSYELSIQVQDANGNGVTGLSDTDFTKTCASGPSGAPGTACPADVGVVFGQITADQAKGDGQYTMAVRATKAGAHNIGLWVSGIGAALGKKGDPTQKYVTATFLPMRSIDTAKSSFTMTAAGAKFASAVNDPAPAYFHTGVIELRDPNGNAITGAVAAGKLAWAETDPPADRVKIVEDATPGRYSVQIWSAKVGAYSGQRVRFTQGDGSDAYLTEQAAFEFVDHDPTSATSSMVATTTADQPANYDAPGVAATAWGRQTVTVTLQDPSGLPYEGAVGRLAASSPDPGVRFAAPAGDAGEFGCAAQPQAGPCAAGVYSLEVYSSLAGAKRIDVAYTSPAGATFAVKEAGSGADHVTVRFVTPPAAPAWSVFVLGDPVVNPDETSPQDDWDDPADAPDGGDSVEHDTGIAFHPNVRIWDAGRRNPVAGAEVRLTLDPSCPAKFDATGTGSYAATSTNQGKVSDSVDSATAAQCVITAEVRVGGAWHAVAGSPKRLTWLDTTIDAKASAFDVSQADVVADGRATGVVSVDLVDVSGHAVKGAQGQLAASGPAGGGLTVSAFTESATTQGRYTASFSGLKAGDQEITVEAAGAPLALAQGGNRFARMVAGPPAAATSWLVEPAGTAPADAKTSLPVKVRVFDAQKNPATSGAVVFAIPAGTAATTAAGHTAGPATVSVPVAGGSAQLALTAKVAAVHQISASVDGAAVSAVKNAAEDTTVRGDGKAEAAFTPGPPAPAASELTVPTAAGGATKEVGGTAKHTAQVQVRDAQGNAAPAGSAKVVFSWEHTDLNGAQVTGAAAAVAVDASGRASFDFGSNVATTWFISARIEGAAAAVGGSPAPARFVHGPLDRLATLSSFTVDSGAKASDGIAHAAARMRAQDQYGNPIAGVDLGIRLDYSGSEGPAFGDATSGAKTMTASSGEDGWVTGEIYSIWPGDFNVRGVADSAESGPQAVHFQSVPADPGTSWFNVKAKAGNSADPAIADGQDGYLVTVGLLDANKAPLNGAGAVVYFTPRGVPGASERSFPVVTGAAGRGLATVALTTLAAGSWDVTARIGGDSLATDDSTPVKAVSVVFAPGPPAVTAGASRLVSPQAPAKADGAATQTVNAEVKDANGNGIGGQTVVFAIPAGVTARPTGLSAVTGPASVSLATGAAAGLVGVAELPLTSTKTGAYEITASVGGKAIAAGSPAAAVFVNADLSLRNSEFAITTAPAVKTVATEYHVAQVTLRDASGNLYTPAVPISFAYQRDSAAAWISGPTVNTVGGVATWSDFTVSAAGLYRVRAEAPTGQVPDSTTLRDAWFKAGPASAADSTFTASTGDVAPNNSDRHSAAVAVRDALDNPVDGATVTFNLRAGDPAHFATTGCGPKTCAVTTAATGLAAVGIVSPSETTTHVVATLGPGETVGEADLVFATGAADPNNSSWSISPAGPVTADGAASFTATVEVKDAGGLPKPGATVSFALPAAVRIAEAAPHLTDPNGRLVVHLTSTVAGTYGVSALIGADPIPEAGRQITFAAGPISYDAAATRLTGPASSALADGHEIQAVTATVRDSKGNPVKGALVRFAIPAGVTPAAGGLEITTDAAGEARLRLVSRASGRHAVTAEIQASAGGAYKPITGGSPAEIEFTAGPVALDHSRISKAEAGPLPADGKTAYNVKVQLADQHDNPIAVAGTAVAVTFELVGADGTTAVAGVAPVVKNLQTDSAGTAATAFATTRAGRWRATADITAGQVAAGSPLVLEFSPLAAAPARSQFDVTGSTVLADGKANHSAWVIALDAGGNPVPGTEVEFAVETGAAGVPGPNLQPGDGVVKTCDPAAPGAPAWCDRLGKAQVAITSEEPGSFRVKAQIGGAAVAGSPKPVSFASGAPSAHRSAYTLSPDTAAGPQISLEASGDPADSYR